MYKNCIECPNHLIVNDPDPTDSFCDDDVAVLCKLAKNDENCVRWCDDMLFPHKPITVSCRPHHIHKECNVPNWCALIKDVKKLEEKIYTMKESIIQETKEEFFKKIDEKNSWGKNEIKTLFLETLNKVMIERLNGKHD